MYWFKRKYRQIQRVIDFLPMIWKGFDFDYRYSIELFKKQLERQAKHLESERAHTLSAPINAQKIRTAIRLMDKVYDEDYALEYFDIIEKKYGKSKMDFIKSGEVDKKGDPYYTMEESFETNYTEVELSLIEDEKHSLHIECRAKQKRAHRLLWSYIEHNILQWWD